ncbi:MAG TPA: bifunctional 5,10-methylenetetrahydrofolate dehydrogenase/5,10-methenyltetrahydrofolate cyclohydrolase [Patescibacteria group bacterium]|nr:bifunctional 5,10-methylenetetrahydrofolate dehydrogenase/5,10-methenyltetrahydrofolate cyclohydrolase [Patescibacteria group bacterium]
MKINGTEIAEQIRNDIRLKINDLRLKNITPKIAIITLGDESSWEAYVAQKLKVAAELGIEAELINLKDANQENLLTKIAEINDDNSYHGIIVQRPMPANINKEVITNAILPGKDVDGFRSDSPFEVPVWMAVKRILEETRSTNPPAGRQGHESWKKLNFVVLGKGETAGGPIIRGLRKLEIEPKIIDSKTENRTEILKNADVIITCVGKREVIKPTDIMPGVTLIGVGTHGEDLPAGRQVESKRVIRGDYLSHEVEEIAGFYTPTPGGVGPINLSYLFSNLIQAATIN